MRHFWVISAFLDFRVELGFWVGSGRQVGIFDHQIARDLLIGDFLQNSLHIVQNGPLGVSEQGQIRVVWEIEPLGFPTGLARDDHARRVIITL